MVNELWKEWDEKCDAMMARYPNLYSERVHIECDMGWLDMLERLSAKLEPLIAVMTDDSKTECYVAQVKSKFGTLRFYMYGATVEMYKLIDKAEHESYNTCEICGSNDNVTSEGGWVVTHCLKCRTESQCKRSVNRLDLLVKHGIDLSEEEYDRMKSDE